MIDNEQNWRLPAVFYGSMVFILDEARHPVIVPAKGQKNTVLTADFIRY